MPKGAAAGEGRDLGIDRPWRPLEIPIVGPARIVTGNRLGHGSFTIAEGRQLDNGSGH